MEDKDSGSLLIIGGSEDKYGECAVLNKFVEMANGRKGKIAIITTATEFPKEVGSEYRALFSKMGVESATVLYIDNRECASDDHLVQEIDVSTGVFFTGGDQLRLTSILGGSEVDKAISRAFNRGAVIAGTSAGASAMSDTMIVGGNSSDTLKKSSLNMAHGLGLLKGVVIDQHFAQRGRINRLLAAVAQNPNVLGIGIDEDTALVVNCNGQCEVIGSQTITVIDGKDIVYSNISESNRNDPLALTNIGMHVLPSGFGFDLNKRKPYKVEL